LRRAAGHSGAADKLDGDDWQLLRVGGRVGPGPKTYNVPPQRYSGYDQAPNFAEQARTDLVNALDLLRQFKAMHNDGAHVVSALSAGASSGAASASGAASRGSFWRGRQASAASAAAAGAKASASISSQITTREVQLKGAARALFDAERALQRTPFFAGAPN